MSILNDFNPEGMADAVGAKVKAKIADELNKRITGVRANKGAIIDNISLIYSDKSVVQIGGNGGGATPVYEVKADERIVSVTYSEASFCGYACIGMVEFLTNTNRPITIKTDSVPRNAKIETLKAPAGKCIYSLKGALAGGKYASKLEIEEIRDM